MIRILGLFLILLPFIFITVFVINKDGLEAALIVWGISLSIVSSIALGIWLFYKEKK